MQRKTQTAVYWQSQFSVSHKDVETLYNQILEENQVLNLDDIALTLVRRQFQAEELASRSEFQQGSKLYQPKQSYTVGDKLVFPVLNFAGGTVVHTRQGQHPQYGPITVIGVAFDNDDSSREFVANFDHPHVLNVSSEQTLVTAQGLLSPEEIYQTYREYIRPKVQAALGTNAEFIAFHDQYFLRDLLPDFHEGLFNIADAAIDINNGPLSVNALIEQMGLASSDEITEVLRFSVNYRLANDERFDDVGPSGQVLWYLERIEPPEAHHPPRRLQISGNPSYDPSQFDNDLRALIAEIDDEATPPEHISSTSPGTDSITVIINYPHRRVGTLPLTPKTQPFFPISYFNPVLFEFIDGRTGNTFPGWTVLDGNYIFGLDEWYNKNKLPVGAYITIKRTSNPMQIIVDFQATRAQRDWVRTASVTGNKLTFQMSKEPIGCKYEELMVIGEANPSQIDNLWLNLQEKELSIYEILCQLFPELSKLNPQSTVHAKTLYSAVNVIRRTSPGMIFQELLKHRCFIPMRHGYWTFDPSLRD